ncbi:MAG TPA: hypothetical protein PKE47_14145 [Verrucomicrobiota bacterium]|nr:hypothetical protein [Verrucomicrobiota bacterium]
MSSASPAVEPSAANLAYVEEVFEQFRRDPASVAPEWRAVPGLHPPQPLPSGPGGPGGGGRGRRGGGRRAGHRLPGPRGAAHPQLPPPRPQPGAD